MCYSDDYGFSLYNIRKITGDVYPLDADVGEAEVVGWVKELLQKKVLVTFRYGEKELLFVRNWFEHQKISTPSKRMHVHLEDIYGMIKDIVDLPGEIYKNVIEAGKVTSGQRQSCVDTTSEQRRGDVTSVSVSVSDSDSVSVSEQCLPSTISIRELTFPNWKPPLSFQNDGRRGREDDIEAVGNEYKGFPRFLDRIAKNADDRAFLGKRLMAHWISGRSGVVIFVRGSDFDPTTVASTMELAGLWTELSPFEVRIVKSIRSASAKMAGADIYFCFKDSIRKVWIAFTQEALNRLIVIEETGEVTTRKGGNGLPNI